MLARGTKPKLRESLDLLRLSPITKYFPAGMLSGWGADDAMPPGRQQKFIVSHVSGR